MSQIIITQGKLLKKDIVKVAYAKNIGSNRNPAEGEEKYSDPPHRDLKNAFASLAIHAILVGEYVSFITVKDIENPDPELVKNFTVTGFSCVGEDIESGVILSARKTLKTGKQMGFNTPIIRFEDPSDDPYPFAENLEGCIEKCKDELTRYLNGKFAPDPQLPLFADEKKESKKEATLKIEHHGEPVEEAKVKKSRKKKDS